MQVKCAMYLAFQEPKKLKNPLRGFFRVAFELALVGLNKFFSNLFRNAFVTQFRIAMGDGFRQVMLGS